MGPARNLADPDDEPTDAELAELMRAAFAEVADARARSLQEMRARIADAQAVARRRAFARPSERAGTDDRDRAVAGRSLE